MGRLFSTVLVFLLGIFLALNQAVSGQESKVDFNRDIRPVLAENCFSCHGPDQSQRKAGLRLDKENEAKANRKGTTAIVPGAPGKSELISRIQSADSAEIMPPPKSGKKLSPDQIQGLSQWVKQGAQWSQHWAHEKPILRQAPSTKNKEWSRNWVDKWLLWKIENAGLSPSPDAVKTTLIRRVYFDVIGLPPPPEAVEIFLKDTSPKALEKVVDQLLKSEHFGERMAMYWLDLVRFADTVGYHGDQDHHASPYRDYVIDAFNRNLSFAQFTIEQLAGDLLPKPNSDQLIATCYNRLLQTSHEGGVQAKEYLAIYSADRVRNFSAVWLGGTLGCAQCHDHKFDPYTTKDFYSLAAFFADIDEAKHLKGGADSIPTKRLPEVALHSSRELAQIEKWKAALAQLENDPQGNHQAEIGKTKEKLKELEKSKRLVMVTQAITPRTIRVLPRGNWLDDTGEVVAPAVPQFLGKAPVKEKTQTRLDLANWLFDTKEGVAELTARVFVNRVWSLFFGNGLARNLDDFGAQGEFPVHPELLDNLALEFQNSGWDVKALIRLIVLSRAYSQSSTWTADLLAKDPNNRLFARQSSFRLPAEMIRDNALAISGLLVSEFGGGSIKPYQPAGYYRHLNFPKREYVPHADARQWRRGVYIHWQRQFLHPMLKAFDAPTREECTAKRQQSNTPLSALVLMNDPTFVEAARIMAFGASKESAENDEVRMQKCFLRVTSRNPEKKETEVLLKVLAQARQEFRAQPALAEKLLQTGLAKITGQIDSVELASWVSVCRVLLNLAETNFRN
ncbi:MAG: DUF1553 domain-containing protein [Gemmataceae bacterium]|nr:DUF1553 domain-containing protein [Gemmataceae bacterium]